jgi:hypothetical protein
VSVSARVGLLVTVLTLIVGLLFVAPIQSARAAAREAAAAMKAVADQADVDDENGSALRTQEDEGGVDLYGNQVSDAIAKYGLDSTGGLYELHSPQTELPRLKSPKS